MKILTIALFLLFSMTTNAQNISFNKDSVSYKMVDSNLTAGKTDLHRKAQGWVIDHFGRDKQVIRLDDMDTGELTGEATIKTSKSDSSVFSFKVSSRDRQYECEIHSLSSENSNSKQVAAATDKKIRRLLRDLHQRMRNDKNFAAPSVDTVPKL